MILDQIVETTKQRLKEAKEMISLEMIKDKAKQMNNNRAFDFEKALQNDGLSFICEVKKASPSKGVIAEYFPYIEIAKNYEAAGASAISVLTEPIFFQGSNQYLKEIRSEVSIPLLRKDFTIDPYQIYEAKVIGADAILLICAILSVEEMHNMIQLADMLGLSCLVEAHTKEEIEAALSAGARVIGINNRNLKTFEVDIETSIKLRKYVPENLVFVSESGIKSTMVVKRLQKIGTDAVLIGETLMHSSNVKQLLQHLKG